MGRRVQCSIYSNQVTSLLAGSFTMVNFHVENFSRSTHPLRRDVISHATTAISYAMWAEIWASEKVEWVEIPVLFFAVCGRKFTKFGTHVGEWLQLPTPFSDRRYLVPIRRYSRSNHKFRNFDVFGPPSFWGEGPFKFLTKFKKLQSPPNM